MTGRAPQIGGHPSWARRWKQLVEPWATSCLMQAMSLQAHTASPTQGEAAPAPRESSQHTMCRTRRIPQPTPSPRSPRGPALSVAPWGPQENVVQVVWGTCYSPAAGKWRAGIGTPLIWLWRTCYYLWCNATNKDLKSTFSRLYEPTSVQNSLKKTVPNYVASDSVTLKLMFCKLKIKFALELYQIYTFNLLSVGHIQNEIWI